MNKSLLKIIKTRLQGVNGARPEELPNVLWAYKTTTKVPTRKTPFRLTFGTEAIILMEIGLTNIRVKAYEVQRNPQELNNNLDLINKVRDEASKWVEKYRAAMARYYIKKVKVRRFNVGDIVLKKVSQATKDSSQGKPGPTWEGPYQVIRHSREGSYYLKTLDDQKLLRPWNIEHLKEILPVKTVAKYSKMFAVFTFIFLPFIVIYFT